MRVSAAVVSSLLNKASAIDLCAELCKRDGPSVCTKGSWTKSNGYCQNYLYRGDPANKEICYHTPETAAGCPSTGAGVKAADVAGILGTLPPTTARPERRDEIGTTLRSTTQPRVLPRFQVIPSQVGLWLTYRTEVGQVRSFRSQLLFINLRHKGKAATERYAEIASTLRLCEELVSLRGVAAFPPNPAVRAHVAEERDGSGAVECFNEGTDFARIHVVYNDRYWRSEFDQIEGFGSRICSMALAIQEELEFQF
jgi:hypothetical protein